MIHRTDELKTCQVLDSFGLTQHVAEPPHSQGYTLDLMKSKDLSISKNIVTDVVLSDHSCVFFWNFVPVHRNYDKKVQYITENTSDQFTQAFSPTPALPWTSVNELTDN